VPPAGMSCHLASSEMRSRARNAASRCGWLQNSRSLLVGTVAIRPRVSLSRLNQPAVPAMATTASAPKAIFLSFIGISSGLRAANAPRTCPNAGDSATSRRVSPSGIALRQAQGAKRVASPCCARRLAPIRPAPPAPRSTSAPESCRRVQRGVGQQVGGGFHVGKRNEHRARRRAVVLTGGAAPPRRAGRPRGSVSPGSRPSGPGRRRAGWRWARAPAHRARRCAGHAAGVPVLQLAAGDEHHGVVGIGPLVGPDDVGRHQLHAPVGVGKRSWKTMGWPGSSALRQG
jgi:hypothetical protein